MKTKTIFLVLIAFVAGFSACDIIDGPKVDPKGFTGSTNKVLIEDFTGHMCGNCPPAHEKAQELKASYGDNVVVVAVHSGGFARVFPQTGYGYDFNTTMGTEVDAFFQANALTGLPIGLVGRRQWGALPLTRLLDWGTDVAAVLAEAPKMRMEVSTAYDPSTRNLVVSTDLEYFITGNADHHIVAIITEDSIIAKQADYRLTNPDVENYVHMHVLRGAVTPGGTWGTPVKDNQIFLGEKLSLQFSRTLDPSWVPEHCHVVVYVHDNATKEILQVEEVKLVE